MKKIVIAAFMSAAISCATDKSGVAKINPLLDDNMRWETPYGIAPFEQIKADHYLAAVDLAVEELGADIESIVGSDKKPTFDNTIVAFDRAGWRLKGLKDLFEMSEASISTPDYQRVSEVVTPQFIAAWDSVYMNEELFDRIESINRAVESGEVKLNRLDARLLDKIYRRFVKGGSLLSSEQKQQLAQINSQIALLSTRFTHNLIAENDNNFITLTSAQLKGIPQTTRSLAALEAKRKGVDGWAFTLTPTSVIPVLTLCEDRSVREQIYKAYQNRGSESNHEIVKEVTKLRQQRAQLLGYRDHADYVISDQMAGSVEAVYKQLDSTGIWKPALERAIEERKVLERQFAKDHKNEQFEAWDWRYYTERIRNNQFSLSSTDLRNYFAIDGVRTGMFTLANRLYGVDFRPTTAPLYDPDCMVYELVDKDHTLLGVLYLDLYARPTKAQGAWCGNLREQSYNDDGERVIPIVAIVCNFPRPSSDSEPLLLDQEQVETLFHEFGHALHFLMQDVKYQTLAAVEGDFVEFPSQVMENWAFEPEMLRMYAVHNRTGKPITEQIISNIVRAKGFNQGYEVLSVLSAALLDLDLQRLPIDSLETLDIDSFTRERLNDQRGLISQIDPRYQLYNFAHLFSYDYSAGYYFYLWAEMLDKELFAEFKRSGDLFSKPIADKMRAEVLERGGERSGKEMTHSLIGRDPSAEPLLKSKGF
ncbi:MAG: M3 family metallopeptidase [Rikenellaceae bacterium]